MGEKAKWKRNSKNCREFTNSTESSYKKTKAKIQKVFKTTKKGVKCSTILSTLSLSPHFIGCFSQDTLVKLELCYPCFLMVNTDSAGKQGSHWIAIRIDENQLEIFDPLGFKIFNWKSVPCKLLEFIHYHALNKKILISPRIQPDNSYFCALYCIFFIFFRNFNSFQRLYSLFSRKLHENDQRLLTLLDV